MNQLLFFRDLTATIRLGLMAMTFCGLGLATPAAAQPAVVPTAEGQVGAMPAAGSLLGGVTFESNSSNSVILGGALAFSIGTPPPPPEFGFLTDMIHGYPDPVPIVTATGTDNNIAKTAPVSSRILDASDTAFAFSLDGTAASSMNVLVKTFNGTGQEVANFMIPDIPTFPDPSFNRAGVAYDNQGRVTVAYTEIPPMGLPQVKVRLFNGTTGQSLSSDLQITQNGGVFPAVALLDPAGNRLIVPTSDFSTIRGNIVDTTGASPVVLPEFPISTTAGFTNGNPAVAADPTTGRFTVAWENVTAVQGDPIDVRARRFDAMGNPIGGDFRVNTTTANTQAQPAVAVDPNSGASVIVWAGDAATIEDGLDVFGQVYDATGNPIGGEIRVNTFTTNFQDRPAVRFLAQPDVEGRPQFTVAWRDVGEAGGSTPRGTGTSYRCFSIDGLEDPAIFADGFESGDTTTWSADNP